MSPKVMVIATGGTIAMRHEASKGGMVPAVNGAELLAALPSLRGEADIEVSEFCNIPSFHMSPAIMAKLALHVEGVLARDDVAGAVITHGTDTLEESAYFLDLFLPPGKPVCFTGAMRAADEISSDGPANIFAAVRAAASPLLRGAGTVVVMNEEIHEAEHVSKMHRSAVQAFVSLNAGPLGRVDKSGVALYRAPCPKKTLRPSLPLPQVPILKMYSGMDASLFDALLAGGMDGLVLDGFGLGNVPDTAVSGIERVLAAKVPVVASSRVPAGATRGDYAAIGGAGHLATLGVMLCGALSSHKARILLMLGIGAACDRQGLAALFAAGEKGMAGRQGV